MEEVKHLGVVESIHENTMRVRVEQTSACTGCNAGSVCSSADKKDKWIDIPSFTGEYHSGQSVFVVGKTSFGLKAVALAYVIPLFLMMTVLVISSLWLFPGKDALAAILSLSATILYFFILYPFRKTLKNRFDFTVRPSTDSSTASSTGINPSL